MALHFAVHLSGWSLLRAHRALEIKLPLVRIDARLIAPQALARLTRSLRRRRGSFGGRMAPDHVGCGGDCFHLRLGGSSEARGWSTSAHSSEASILRGLLKRLANCACHSSKAPPSLLWSRLVKGIRQSIHLFSAASTCGGTLPTSLGCSGTGSGRFGNDQGPCDRPPSECMVPLSQRS